MLDARGGTVILHVSRRAERPARTRATGRSTATRSAAERDPIERTSSSPSARSDCRAPRLARPQTRRRVVDVMTSRAPRRTRLAHPRRDDAFRPGAGRGREGRPRRARRGARRLRDVALSIPVVITINDRVGSVAPANLAHLPVAPADAGDGGHPPRGRRCRLSGRAHPERALVVLDRVARALTFARGVVYLRDPPTQPPGACGAWWPRRATGSPPRIGRRAKGAKGTLLVERARVEPGEGARKRKSNAGRARGWGRGG